MISFTGKDVYGIRWWYEYKNNDEFISCMKYTKTYDSIMTKEQIQDAKNEFETLDAEELKKVRVQVYLYIYARQERAWWCIDTDKIKQWFQKMLE